MINNVVLTGRLTKDLDLKFTSNGKAVASFQLAVNRSFKNAQGETEADYISCQIWGKTAENLANFTRKGSLIGVQGRIQTRNYENQQGERVYVTEVVVENFTFLESRNQSAAPTGQSYAGNEAASTSNDSLLDDGQTIDISDDDLPF